VECLAEVEAWEAEWVEEALSQPEILLEVDPKLKKSIDLYLVVVVFVLF
jgi:hypothetical protein